jgi:hypothetical protein
MANARQTKGSIDEGAATARSSKELEVHEDMTFQRRDWLAQRIGWGAIGLILLAALAGLAGSGPLSRVTRTDGRHFTIEYDRFVRHGARTALTLRVAPEAIAEGRVRIAVDRDFLVANDLQRLVPEPNATRGREGAVEFIYDVAPGDGLQVRWTLEPDQLGSHSASVRLNDAPAIQIEQFTYP